MVNSTSNNSSSSSPTNYLRAACLALLVAGCSGDSTPNEQRMLVFLQNLPRASDNTTYELWFKNGDAYTPVTRFDTDTGTVSLSLPLTAAMADAVTLIVTLEASAFEADEPSDSVLLAGDFIDIIRIIIDPLAKTIDCFYFHCLNQPGDHFIACPVLEAFAPVIRLIDAEFFQVVGEFF